MTGFICPARKNALVTRAGKVDARGASTFGAMLK